LGHEYVQKTALTFVDGILINPVIGRKQTGDFKDDAILKSYEALLEHYYPADRAVMVALHTEMRYAGPREAIYHAIVRKNLGCTHFIVGRDHAGVGNFYDPFAAHAIFDQYPDLGIQPLFFSSFFYCRHCGAVANDKTCPHGDDERIAFSGTLLRNLLSGGEVPEGFIRTEVATVLQSFERPLIEAP
jgi:sulfate adenylyltransferase